MLHETAQFIKAHPVSEEVKLKRQRYWARKEAEKQGTLVASTIDFPQDVASMFDDVFEEMPWHLREQCAQAVRERKLKWPE